MDFCYWIGNAPRDSVAATVPCFTDAASCRCVTICVTAVGLGLRVFKGLGALGGVPLTLSAVPSVQWGQQWGSAVTCISSLRVNAVTSG